MVTLLYFASLRESVGVSREQMNLPSGNATVSSLVEQLRSRNKRYRVAVNQQIASPSTPIRPGDEVAFFPPVTGG